MTDSLPILHQSQPIYNIVYSKDFEGIREFISKYDPDRSRKACVVSDSKVASVYMDAILSIANECFASATSYVFPEGEASKNLNTVKDIYVKLINENFNRHDVLIALGGGVTGDMCGFTAATYLRGIDFIQIPTSLLADVDSSIGGKTGVDFDSYKNMVGAFHMPKIVYINTSTLKTLDTRQLYSGLGEVVKSALIKDSDFFTWLTQNITNVQNLEEESIRDLIYKCNIIKKNIVDSDPYETLGERALLNFGHTIGHALEKYMNFEFLHGECVSIGCILASYISMKKGLINENEYTAIFDFYKDHMNLPELPSDIDIDKIVSYTRNDKKAEKSCVKFILLRNIGDAFISKDVSEEDMADSLKYYISLPK
ncbi:MAG: 3-dehydroquinate synthase [Eubacterium sp.]|nr:3-dehydroquinate synthase [Eubacterium sp.]